MVKSWTVAAMREPYGLFGLLTGSGVDVDDIVDLDSRDRIRAVGLSTSSTWSHGVCFNRIKPIEVGTLTIQTIYNIHLGLKFYS